MTFSELRHDGQYEWSFTHIGHWVYTLRTFNPQGPAGYSEINNNGLYGLNNYDH